MTGVLLSFAEFLVRSYKAAKSVTNALSSLRTFHCIYGFTQEAFDDFRLVLWKRALPLTLRNFPSPAPAFSLAEMRSVCLAALRLGRRGATFAALISTAFYSLARLSSLVPDRGARADPTRIPLLRDVIFQGERALVLLKWGKCAQDTSDGFWVPILPVSNSPVCPVMLLKRVLHGLRGQGGDTPLFAYGSWAGARELTWFDAGSARRLLNSLLAGLGWADRGFTFHSLRRGGCTLAFSAGAQLSDLQLLGGWRSRAIDAYYPHLEARSRAAAALANGSN